MDLSESVERTFLLYGNRRMFLPPGDKEAMEMRKRVKTMAYQIPTSKNMEPHPVINEPSIIKERIIKEQSQMPLLLTDNRSMEPPNIIPPPPSLFSPASSAHCFSISRDRNCSSFPSAIARSTIAAVKLSIMQWERK